MDFSSQGPEDQELKNVIDKLAQFVARNGTDFERLTKEKQKNNPRFSFLYGGEYFNYYQYRLTTEQAILRHQKQSGIGSSGSFPQQMPPFPPPGMQHQPGGPPLPPPPHHIGPPGSFMVPPPNFVPPWTNRPPPPGVGMPINVPPPAMPHPHAPHQPPPHVQLQQLQHQLDELQEQVNSSDRNLAAQRDSLMGQKQAEIEQLRLDLPRRTLQNLVNNTGLALEEFDRVVQPVVEACTKDNIASAKTWILTRLNLPEHFDLFSLFLFHRAIMMSSSGSGNFDHCLHLVYLCNDLLHHAVRKGVDPLRISLRRVIPALFSEALLTSGGDEDRLAKLTKLTNLWRQNNYLDEQVLMLLEDKSNCGAGRAWFLSEIMHSMLPSGDCHFAATCNDIEKRYTLQYCQLEQQNNEYAAHIHSQMQQIKQMMQNVASQIQGPPPMPMFQPPHNSGMMGGPPPNAPWSSPPPPPLLPPNQNLPPPLYGNVPPPLMGHPEPPAQQQSMMVLDTSRPPPSLLGGPPLGHHTSPGFGATMPPQRSTTPPPPPVPYYDLPAGLIVPLIKPEDNNYDPIDPSKVRLPLPCPPTERLLAAVEAFYAPPSHDNPRDSEGWERLGLYEFYQAKERAIREAKLKNPPIESEDKSKDRPHSGRGRNRSRSHSGSRSSSGSPVPYLRTSRSRSRSASSNDSFKGRVTSSKKGNGRKRRSRSRSSSGSPRR